LATARGVGASGGGIEPPTTGGVGTTYVNVLLVHGLGRTPFSLFGLAGALRRAGHATRFFAYSPTFESLSGITCRLSKRLKALASLGQPVGLVGHSLGGLLLRLALAETPGLQIHRLVMLGTPNRSTRMAQRAWRRLPFRLLTRECGEFLASPDAIARLPFPSFPYVLIAGTAGPRRVWLPTGDEPNDGIVRVDEVRIQSSDPVMTFPVWHTVMMNNHRVQQAVVEAFNREQLTSPSREPDHPPG